ncbi:MAG: NAD(P)H-hydrate epimerase [Gemmatales bacterium]|nr:MAG: NAD(P)H-hydrate epimerase [Gemmatales bacterium]
MHYLSRDEAREIDRRAIEEFHVPGIVLMENAGRNAAEILRHLGVAGPVHLCCGKGNNGGDGFVIARHLHNHDIDAVIHIFFDPTTLKGDASTNFQIVRAAHLPIRKWHPQFDGDAFLHELSGADWIVDALFGTGFRGRLASPYDRVVDLINQSGQRILAVDVPSGVDCDTGQPEGNAVHAQHTVTFVAAKKGFADPASKQWTGQVHVVDIGAPKEAYQV